MVTKTLLQYLMLLAPDPDFPELWARILQVLQVVCVPFCFVSSSLLHVLLLWACIVCYRTHLGVHSASPAGCLLCIPLCFVSSSLQHVLLLWACIILLQNTSGRAFCKPCRLSTFHSALSGAACSVCCCCGPASGCHRTHQIVFCAYAVRLYQNCSCYWNKALLITNLDSIS